MKIQSTERGWAITWKSSKLAFFTGRLLVDRIARDDFARAYAYLRWVDDKVDLGDASSEERVTFVKRQVDLIERLLWKEYGPDLVVEEEMLAAILGNERGSHHGLQSFIRNMIDAIEFDARRKGRLISQEELNWYTERVALSVTDGAAYFIRHSHADPQETDRLKVVKACHVSHLLRDMVTDVAEGFVNIPGDYLESNAIGPRDVQSAAFRAWVKDRVDLARGYFKAGKRYYDEVDVLRVKVVLRLYCARFEEVLDTIEQDGFILRKAYGGWMRIWTFPKLVGIVIALCARHIFGRLLSGLYS